MAKRLGFSVFSLVNLGFDADRLEQAINAKLQEEQLIKSLETFDTGRISGRRGERWLLLETMEKSAYPDPSTWGAQFMGVVNYSGARRMAPPVGDIKLFNPFKLTIKDGAVTAFQTYHTIDTEADAVADNLDTINGGVTGDVVALQVEDISRAVTVKDGTGNVDLLQGDVVLDTVKKSLLLIFDSSRWRAFSATTILANQLLFGVKTITGTTTLLSTDPAHIEVDAGSGGVPVKLPPALAARRVFLIRKTNGVPGNRVTITPSGSDTIGANLISFQLKRVDDSVILVSNGKVSGGHWGIF